MEPGSFPEMAQSTGSVYHDSIREPASQHCSAHPNTADGAWGPEQQ